MSIQDNIQEKINQIEKTEQVRILHAVESGSRAWGFASPDSDYDVRFIYLRRTEDYLKLNAPRDVIEFQLDEILDINGWDLKKMLCLLRNANPTIFEWAASPIIYRTTDSFQQMKPVINSYFSCKAGMYHYLNTAHTNYRNYLKGDMVRLKKYFYVIRPILACRWILEYQKPVPMLFSELKASVLEADMQPVIDNLLQIKQHLPESGMGEKIPELNRWIDENMEKLKQQADALPNDKNKDWNALNQVFLKCLQIY